MSLFQRSIAQARSAAVLDSDGSTSGSSVMEEVLVSDAQTFASMNLCESEDHMVEEIFCDESFITDCDSTTLVRPEMSNVRSLARIVAKGSGHRS